MVVSGHGTVDLQNQGQPEISKADLTTVVEEDIFCVKTTIYDAVFVQACKSADG